MLKPQFLVFLLWAALRRHWSFFSAFLLSFLAIQAASIAAFGWHNEIEYVAVLVQLSRHGEAYFANQSVNGLLQRLLGNADTVHFDLHGFAPYNRAIYLGTTVSSAFLLAIGLLLPLLRRWQDSTLDLLFFGLVATVASPIAWSHHYGYFFAAAVYMIGTSLFQQGRMSRLFQLSFVILTIPVSAGILLVGTRFTVLASFELFAGFGLMFSLALLADKASRQTGSAAIDSPVSHPVLASIPAS